MFLPNGKHIVRRDSCSSWFRVGTEIQVSGSVAVGQIWTGHKMTVVHDKSERAALLSVVDVPPDGACAGSKEDYATRYIIRCHKKKGHRGECNNPVLNQSWK